MKEPWGSTHQKGGSRRTPCRSPDAESNDPTWPATIITTPRRPAESEERIQMDPIWIRRHPRPPVRPTQPPPHDTQVATAAPRTTPMGDPPAAPPDPTFARRSSGSRCPAPAKTRRMGRSPAAAQPARLRPAALWTTARRGRVGGRQLGFSPGSPAGATRGAGASVHAIKIWIPQASTEH